MKREEFSTNRKPRQGKNENKTDQVMKAGSSISLMLFEFSDRPCAADEFMHWSNDVPAARHWESVTDGEAKCQNQAGNWIDSRSAQGRADSKTAVAVTVRL